MDKAYNKVVYTYLVADFIHIGHLNYVKKAKQKGDFLIVGCLTDEAVCEKKPMPIIPYKERLETLKAIKYIDKVVKQSTYSPLANVKKFKPDVLVESESHKEMPANEYVESYGGKVVILPYYKGVSSTDIKDKIKKVWKT